MSAPTHNNDLEVLYTDLQKFANIAGVTFNGEAVQKLLDVFEDVYTRRTISVRTTTHAPEKRDVNFRYMAPDFDHNPFERLQQAGLYTLTGHPIEQVIPEVTERGYAFWWGMDSAITHGVEKIWLFFEEPVLADDVLSMASIPDCPKNHREHLHKIYPGTFVSIIGLDFWRQSLNFYPAPFPPGTLTLDKIIAIFDDLGMDRPADNELDLIQKLVGFYYTFRWDEPDVQRVCFTIYTPPEGFPIHWHPLCQSFVEQAPFQADQRMFIYSPTYGRNGNYLKMEADYCGTLPQILARSEVN